jgi:hypothetical protein
MPDQPSEPLFRLHPAQLEIAELELAITDYDLARLDRRRQIVLMLLDGWRELADG